MTTNILTENGQSKYYNAMFTEKGLSTLQHYLQSLTKIYMKEQTYPLSIGVVFGIPMFEYSNIFISKEALLERIKMLAQILGTNKIIIDDGRTIKELNL